MKILYLTSFIPKKNASQAGVNVTFDIIKTIKNNYNDVNMDVAGLINEEEYNTDSKCDLEYIDNKYFIPIKKVSKIKNVLLNLGKPIICSVRYDKSMINLLKKIINKNKYDYVLIDYTQNIAYIDVIKEINPNLKVAIVEHDVSFLSFERKYKNCSNIIKKYLLKMEYKRIFKYEREMLLKYDYVFTLNYKDSNLLEGLDNVGVITPYFNRFELSKISHDSFNIMFWGAMNRKENEDAVIFFINDIWPYINKKDYNVKFYIVGSKPTDKIKSLESDDIIVTGFVEDPKDYFNIMDLSVIPLRYGAGIKIKVLESLAAGIPVITTDVGAEGINIINEKSALISNESRGFIKNINNLLENRGKLNELECEGLKLIKNNYDVSGNIKTIKKFIDR